MKETCPKELLKKLVYGNAYMSMVPDSEAFLDFLVKLHVLVAADPILDDEGELAG